MNSTALSVIIISGLLTITSTPVLAQSAELYPVPPMDSGIEVTAPPVSETNTTDIAVAPPVEASLPPEDLTQGANPQAAGTEPTPTADELFLQQSMVGVNQTQAVEVNTKSDFESLLTPEVQQPYELTQQKNEINRLKQQLEDQVLQQQTEPNPTESSVTTTSASSAVDASPLPPLN